MLREPRRELHALIAETLESQFAEIAENRPELLARHCTEAGLIEKAAVLWGKAGQRSLERSARSVPTSIEMNADLPSLDQLRSNAAECIRLAEAARTSQHKSLFIEMADRWLTLAEHAAREGRLNGGSLFRDR